MLSILIPIYNYDCRNLIYSLSGQAEKLNVEYEILAFDDGSSLFLEENREIKKLPHLEYRELEKNIGRSAIRNLLAEESHYPYLVFMDCDMQVISDSYLKNYLDHIGRAPVICGGRSFCKKKDLSDLNFLHWTYGVVREPKPGEGGGKMFLSNNFLIESIVFEKIRFDERIRNYGHEDTLFGIELDKKDFSILYIRNPLLHEGLQTNKEFIDKTKESLWNLSYIYKNLLSQEDARNIRLISAYEKFRKMKLTGLLHTLGRIFRPAIGKNLNSRRPSMLLLDFYKLTYFCSVLHSQEKVR